jgi:hypothetical protein
LISLEIDLLSNFIDLSDVSSLEENGKSIDGIGPVETSITNYYPVSFLDDGMEVTGIEPVRVRAEQRGSECGRNCGYNHHDQHRPQAETKSAFSSGLFSHDPIDFSSNVESGSRRS